MAFKCGSSNKLTCFDNTCLPKLSSKKLERRYKAPPETACTKPPNKPAAKGASKITGQRLVVSERAFSLESAR